MSTRPVLFRNTQYGPSEQLPADNEQMVAAWLEAHSAVWVDEDGTALEAHGEAKAKAVTAKPGLAGLSSDGDPEALIGRIPERPERKKPSRRKKAE